MLKNLFLSPDEHIDYHLMFSLLTLTRNKLIYVK